MTEPSDACIPAPGEALPALGITAYELIADHGDDAHAAITILLELVDALQRENVSLAKAVSHGFIRSAWRRNPQ